MNSIRAMMRRRPLFITFTVGAAMLAVAASLWWHYGGESVEAAIVSWASWAFAGALAFVAGLRGEHGKRDGTPQPSCSSVACPWSPMRGRYQLAGRAEAARTSITLVTSIQRSVSGTRMKR